METIQFKEFTLDQNNFRLSENGIPKDIEPQTFEVLLLLINNHQRVVTKDELLDKIWNGKVVTENVITRTIYELRKILNDDPKKQGIIRTVRAKGYQFVAEFKTVNKEKTVKGRFVNNHIKVNLSKIFYIFLFILFIAAAVVFYQFSLEKKELTTNKLFPKHNIVAVLPLNVNLESPELSILAHSITDYLSNQLATNLQTTVLHPSNLSAMKNKFNDIRAIQQATRANYIVEGFVEIVSDKKTKIHLTLYKLSEQNDLIPFSLGSFDFPFPQTTQDLMDLYHQRKATVKEIINLIQPNINFKDNGQAETSDPEAYRMVIAAHHIQRQKFCQGKDRAEELLLRALERDPDFAYAWNKLFYNYYIRVWSCRESTDFYQKALDVAEKIEELAPDKYYSIMIDRNGIFIETNRVEQAYEFIQHTSVDNPDALFRSAYALRYAGFLEKANEAIQRILQIDPLYFSGKPLVKVPNTLLYQNKFEQHLALLAKTGHSYHDYYRALNFYLSGEIKSSENVLKSVLDRNKSDIFSQLSQALFAIIKNKRKKAISILSNIVKKRHEQNHQDGELTYKQAQLFALSGELEIAIENLDLSVKQGFFPASYFIKDPALKSIRNDLRFKEIINNAINRHRMFAKKFNLKSEI